MLIKEEDVDVVNNNSDYAVAHVSSAATGAAGGKSKGMELITPIIRKPQ